jgi:HK97 family phage portal protein
MPKKTKAQNEAIKSVKKDVAKLRHDVRFTQKLLSETEKKLTSTHKDINMFTGVVSGNYWTQTGMPWVTSEGRKAVLTEWFWQPIRGQPRRVDTNELRQFCQTFWCQSCVRTIIEEITSMDWDIIPKDENVYEAVEEEIESVKEFLKAPNKNGDSWESILRALIKDILELDAGCLIKVFDINSYDFDQLEPKSGAPLLKPLGQRKMLELYARDGASFLIEADKFGFERGYWQYSYQIPAHPMWFSKDEVIYIRQHPRSMSVYGYAVPQAIMDLIKSLHYSTLYNKRFFEETSIPDGALALLDTNEAEFKTFLNYWNNEFKAQPHKIAVMNKDMKWQPFSISNRELEFLETQKWYYRLVIGAFGLTPAELGITDDLNKSTSATQAEVSKRKAIRPLLTLLEQAINTGILPELNALEVEFTFIYDDPVEKSQRLGNWEKELNLGLKTINEVRVEEGLAPVAWGDTPANLRPVQTSFGQEEGRPALGGTERPEQPSEDQGGDMVEEAQSHDYEDTLDREQQAKEERDKLTLNPYSIANRPVGSFRSAKPKLTKDVSEKPKKCDWCGIETSNLKYTVESGWLCPKCYNEEDKGKSINKSAESDAQDMAQLIGYEGDIANFIAGYKVELEHIDSVGGNKEAIARIVVDHLTENANYYKDKISKEQPLTPISEVAGRENSTGLQPRKPMFETRLDFDEDEINEISLALNINKTDARILIYMRDMLQQMRQANPLVSNKTIKGTKKRTLAYRGEEFEAQGHAGIVWYEYESKTFDSINDVKRYIDEKLGKSIKKKIEEGKDREYYCPACGKQRTHKFLHYDDFKPHRTAFYECEVCGQTKSIRLVNKSQAVKPASSLDTGQYYHEPLQVAQPSRGFISQPQNNPQLVAPQLGSDYRTGQTYESPNQFLDDINRIKCPYCGFDTLQQANSADDLGQEPSFRCANCAALVSQQELIDQAVMANLTQTMQRNQSQNPISIPSWSPKSANTEMKKEIDMTIKEYVGYDVTKSMQEHAIRYVRSSEFHTLLSGNMYSPPLSARQKNQLKRAFERAINRNSLIGDVADDIDRFMHDKTRSERIAKTEMVRITNVGNIKDAEARGIKEKVWIAAPEDGRRCDKCGKMGGKIFKISDPKIADPNNFPPHAHCRCVLADHSPYAALLPPLA